MIYDANGKRHFEPTFLDLAKRVEKTQTIKEVVEKLQRMNAPLRDVPYVGPFLLDQYGRPLDS